MSTDLKNTFSSYILDLQDRICSALEQTDGSAAFREDRWARAGGGGGRTRVIEGGAVLEKGGVNTSAVHGELPPAMQERFGVRESRFFACGLSLVIHAVNPFVPTVHANYRYFELYDAEGKRADAWFGGGLDLTPNYLFEEDAVHFHGVCKAVCDRHHPTFYSDFKDACDRYFFLSHRGETRGIGGLFFDYCRDGQPLALPAWMGFVTDAGDRFLDAYLPIVEHRKAVPYGDAEREWQEIHRGRYAEFNLIHDRGTLFGLQTGGRTESILMSLPPRARWVYDHRPAPGSEEERLVKALVPREWMG